MSILWPAQRPAGSSLRPLRQVIPSESDTASAAQPPGNAAAPGFRTAAGRPKVGCSAAAGFYRAPKALYLAGHPDDFGICLVCGWMLFCQCFTAASRAYLFDSGLSRRPDPGTGCGGHRYLSHWRTHQDYADSAGCWDFALVVYKRNLVSGSGSFEKLKYRPLTRKSDSLFIFKQALTGMFF